MIRKLTAIIAALLMLCACDSTKHPVTEPVAKVRRTLLVYMEARNNLSSAALDDLAEMRIADIPDDCRLLVYRSINGADHPELVEIRRDRETTLAEYPAEASAVDPVQMATVLADMKKLAPADEYGMVLWSHSSGWRQKSPALMHSRAYGLENGRTMSITNLAKALRDSDLSFLVFDTCYMGSVEVAYELRNAARWMVASVCEVPTPGMPYNLTLPGLFDADMARGLQSAIDITVDSYIADRTQLCPSTLSLIDLSALDDLAAEVKDIIDNPLPEGFRPQRFSVDRPYASLFFDLGQYMQALGGTTTAALERAVIHERHTDKIWVRLPIDHCSGLSVYIPGIDAGYDLTSYDYNTLEWARYMGR